MFHAEVQEDAGDPPSPPRVVAPHHFGTPNHVAELFGRASHLDEMPHEGFRACALQDQHQCVDRLADLHGRVGEFIDEMSPKYRHGVEGVEQLFFGERTPVPRRTQTPSHRPPKLAHQFRIRGDPLPRVHVFSKFLRQIIGWKIQTLWNLHSNDSARTEECSISLTFCQVFFRLQRNVITTIIRTKKNLKQTQSVLCNLLGRA